LTARHEDLIDNADGSGNDGDDVGDEVVFVEEDVMGRRGPLPCEFRLSVPLRSGRAEAVL
jgi:hypothetical protein